MLGLQSGHDRYGERGGGCAFVEENERQEVELWQHFVLIF